MFWNGYLTQISNAMEREHLSELALKARLLDESDRLYKTLFTLISHEFRIPIATIMGASDTLLMPGTSEPDKKQLSSEIYKASARLNHLVENLLNMSRLESGKLAPRPDWCDINDLFNKVINSLGQELEPFHLTCTVPGEMPLVRLDFGLMEQVIFNLLLNSCQNSQPGSSIELAGSFSSGNLYVTIEDEGPGFPPELLDSVFNKFFRVDNSKPGGLGLGLSIVKGVVEAHGGVVRVENREPRGTKFIITIPTETADIGNLDTEQ
jgi:two-component system sensor histidine kinase KdpD